MRCGNEMYGRLLDVGVSIIDVSDITKPHTLSRHEYDPACPEPTTPSSKCRSRSMAAASRCRRKKSVAIAVRMPANRTRRLRAPGT